MNRSTLVLDLSYQRSSLVLGHCTWWAWPATGPLNIQACLTTITCSVIRQTCTYWLCLNRMWLRNKLINTMKCSAQPTINLLSEMPVFSSAPLKKKLTFYSRSRHREHFKTRLPPNEKRPVGRRAWQQRTFPSLVALWQGSQATWSFSRVSSLVDWPRYAPVFWCNICKSQVEKISAFSWGTCLFDALLHKRVLEHEDEKICFRLLFIRLSSYCFGACR